MIEQASGVSLIAVFLIAIITTAVGLVGKIIWDWLKRRKSEKEEAEKPTGWTLKEMREEIAKKQSEGMKLLQEQITLFQTNDIAHLQKSIDKLDEELKNLWTAINGNKEDIKNIMGKLGVLEGKMNGR